MKRIDRRTINALLGATIVSTAVAGQAAAQAYPVKPIRVITPFGAGDSADTIARLIGPRMSAQLRGQPLIIDNRPGASGLVGLQAALQAEPDGYTLVLGQMGGMAVAPGVNRQPFDVRKEFVAIASAFSNYLVLASYAALPQKTFPDVVAFSKANTGKVHAIATTGAKRPPNLPNVPTLAEYSPGFTALGWFGFFGRRGVQETAVTSINRAVNAALAIPEVL